MEKDLCGKKEVGRSELGEGKYNLGTVRKVSKYGISKPTVSVVWREKSGGGLSSCDVGVGREFQRKKKKMAGNGTDRGNVGEMAANQNPQVHRASADR